MKDKGSIICFTEAGCRTAGRIGSALKQLEIEAEIWCKKKDFDPDSMVRPMVETPIHRVEGSLSDWTLNHFSSSRLLVFVGATGIAVRAIAPYIVSKTADPAVLCIDEKGSYVISLLSGHIGRANELTRELADAIGAMPIITTATDLNDRFAVDVFARENHLYISDMHLAKEISAAVLDGKKVGFVSELQIYGKQPPELTVPELADTDLLIYVGGADERRPAAFDTDDDGTAAGQMQMAQTSSSALRCLHRRRVLHLVPKDITLGIGCRKGKDVGALDRFVCETLDKHGVSLQRVRKICSIDLKADEAAITAFCRRYHLPYETFTAQQLLEAPGDYTASSFVAQITGVDNVCERSAVLGSGGGSLLLQKTAHEGMTLAAALAKQQTVRF